MNYRVVFPIPLLSDLLKTLVQQPQATLYCPIGVHSDTENFSYLPRPANLRDFYRPPVGRYMAVSSTDSDLTFADWVTVGVPSGAAAHVVLGRGECRGRWWGMAINGGDMLPIYDIVLAGSQMSQISNAAIYSGGEPVSQPIALNCEWVQRWSRTIGAMGHSAWRRLVSLKVAVIGCGRSGSLAAVTLARLGVNRIILIDPDRLESHNLPEMEGVREADLGRPKVNILCEYLKDYCSASFAPLQVTPCPMPIVPAHRLALRADVLLCCVDNDAGRLACAILAALYHKVLLDIGTGIVSDESSPKEALRIGADIRLILPGQGCLRCLGSIPHYQEVVRELSGLSEPTSQPWWVERMGSMRTLNSTAVHLGLQLLCDLLAGRLSHSRWLQLQYNQRGEPDLAHSDRSEPDPSCPLCSRAGLGDDGLAWESRDLPGG